MKEKFENTKWIIGSRYLKKDGQCNGQNKIDKRKTNALQNTTQKTKYSAIRTTQTPEMNSDTPEG